jgi:hypothetical protein
MSASLTLAEVAEHMWAQAGFDNPLIERSVRNGRPVNDPAKFAYLATRHGTVRFNGLWPRFSCVQGSPNLWGRVEESVGS